ncbi:MAG TPA: dihydroneopterin aldolase [Cellulomonadaceae bacterium]|nr:dihydroneopterin aldolase [Cellulomonadaceae bacterium]
MRALTRSEYEALQIADHIEIVGVTSEGVHGVYAEEALAAQPFVVDVALWLNTDEAVAGDELSATIDYVSASRVVREVVETSTVLLVESLTAAVCEALLEIPGLLAVRATLHKPRGARDAHAADVSLTMTRTR